MAKKILSVVAALLMTAVLGIAVFSVITINEGGRWVKNITGADNIYSDNGYIDYAANVYFDVEKYPDMAEMGLFWTKWNNTTNKMDLKDADSEEGAKLIDPDKPTIIFVHGMLSDGYYQQQEFYLNTDITVPSEFGFDEGEDISLGKLWQREGWNVGYFHYNRFAAEGAGAAAIEGKIWGINGIRGMRYRHVDDTTTDNATQYCLAEHFAAEYIRAMNLLPQAMGQKEIRVAAHSMGGQLGTAGIFLLTELANNGQLTKDRLPDRYAMLDPYFGMMLEGTNIRSEVGDVTINWSGKPLVEGYTGETMVECIKDMHANGIVVEYYAYPASALYMAMSKALISEFQKHCVYVMMQPDYTEYSSAYNIMRSGHNGVNFWYLCSIYADSPVKDVTGDEGSLGVAAAASTPTETMRSLIGTAFIVVEGEKTLNASDDKFIKLTYLPNKE